MNPPRLEISATLRRILDYPKFAGATRLLILGTEYFFDESWSRAAAALGWQSRTVRSAMVGNLTRQDLGNLFSAVLEFKPDFVLASNFAGMDALGLFSRFFEDVRIPYVSWFTDTPRMILHERAIHYSPFLVAAAWERAYMPHLRKLGFQRVYYMPLATDPDLFRPPGTIEHTRPLAFVGTSMVEQANEAWGKFAHLPDVAKAIVAAFDEGRVTREKFAEGIDALFDADLLSPLEPRDRRHLELCLVYEATRRQRAGMAMRLAPFGLEVRGDPNWQAICPRFGGSLSYHQDLAPFYSSTEVNVNSTSLQMKSAVNQRVFDCPAASGFLLTDAQDDLFELFEAGIGDIAYCSLDELEDKVRYYLVHPDGRASIVETMRKQILARHTHQHRLQALEKYLRDIFK